MKTPSLSNYPIPSFTLLQTNYRQPRYAKPGKLPLFPSFWEKTKTAISCMPSLSLFLILPCPYLQMPHQNMHAKERFTFNKPMFIGCYCYFYLGLFEDLRVPSKIFIFLFLRNRLSQEGMTDPSSSIEFLPKWGFELRALQC